MEYIKKIDNLIILPMAGEIRPFYFNGMSQLPPLEAVA